MNLKSYLLAGSVLLILSVWMLTGLFGQDQGADDRADQAPETPMSVQVHELTSQPVLRALEVQGQTEAEADIQLRAEVAGRVTAVQVAEGESVSADQLLIEIAMGNRASLQAEAEARVMQREADFLAAERLGNEGFQSEIAVAQARAELAAARAQLDTIEEQIRHTQIRAPIDGYLETRPVSVGDYVSVGDPVARMIDADPLIITANIAQQNIQQVQPGRTAEVELATGDVLSGRVRFIGSAANDGARTFRIEVEAANPDRLPVGMSATLRVPLGEVQAHKLSPAWLSLADDGQVGIKGLDGDDRVVFYPVEIVRAERGGLWVSGLPSRLRVIVVGQGFVQPGEQVNPIPAERVSNALAN